ncbi:sensor histidine kinase [Halorhabdus amylolytica]|uniref:sensor histidine kinase n=1 Tax=Halorhabdus amylolytica TaxID=2559573 RepID=UPI0010AAB7AD|nr:histidine kinase N-terminal 7TM domain-containing protein [Halorhabdus amylolytica]
MWTVYLALVLFAAILGTAIALYAIVHRGTPGAAPLSLLLLGAAMWSIAEGLSLANTPLDATLFWFSLRLSISTVVPLAWLLTAVEYTGHGRSLETKHLLGLLIEPLAFVVLVWTNGLHDLVWSDPELVFIRGVEYTGLIATRGLAFWGHVAYSYALITLGAFLLVRTSLRADELYRAQSTALLGAIAVPLVANAAYLFRIAPRGIDPTGVAFVASGVIITGAILRNELLTVAAGTREIGRDEIVTRLDDPVFILDENRVLTDYNRAGSTLLDASGRDAVGDRLADHLPTVAETLPEDTDDVHCVTAIEQNGSVRNYDLQATPLERPFDAADGLIVSLRDVTGQIRREQQLDVLNRLLRHNVRNEMNVVRGHAELLAEELEDPDKLSRIDPIVETVDTVTERAEKVATLTRAFEADEPATIDLGIVLGDAIESVRTARPAASFEFQAAEEDLRVRGATSLGVAFEELFENAVEHNDAAEPAVVVSIGTDGPPDSVTVRIADNGPGIDEQERAVIEEGRETALQHGSGIGLWLVAWVVRTFGGTIDFEVDDGTTVVVRLPRAETPEGPDGKNQADAS